MIRAVIFDFDGLILDTEVPDYTAWKETYQRYGADLPMSVWAGVIGGRMADNGFDPILFLEKQIGRRVDNVEAIHATQRERALALLAERKVLPGVEDRIAEAERLGLKLAVASSSSSGWVRGHLDRLGLLHHFSVIRTSDDVTITKPAPDLFLAALDGLGISAGEAVVFEDSPNGVTAAKRAGIFTVAVPNELTAQLDLSHADLKVESLKEVSLADLIARQKINAA